MTAAPIGVDRSPIYVVLANRLRERIVAGEIATGAALPSERDLCHILGASRVTIRRAIATLIDEGLIVRKQGSGTFIAPRIEARGSFLESFSEAARARGETVATVWLTKSLAAASTEEARMLELEPGAQIARLERVRLADGEPLAVELAIVPAAFLPDPASLDESLYATLGRGGFRPVAGTQRLRASLATVEEAALLGIAAGSELLRIERLARLADGRPVEFTRSAYRGDRYDFVSDLRGAAR